MLESQQMPPWMFNLQGTVLEFLGKDPHKPKSLVLEVEQEQLTIKLPKQLRSAWRLHLQPGYRVRCIGRSKVDRKTGVIKLEAYQLFCLPPDTGEEQSAHCAPTSIPTLAASPHRHNSEPRHLSGSPKPKRSKILVCQKSGCHKRGGHQLLVALERLLRERQLQDHVEIQFTGCQKCCSQAPSLTIMPGRHRYERVSIQSLAALIEEHFDPPELRSVSSHVDS